MTKEKREFKSLFEAVSHIERRRSEGLLSSSESDSSSPSKSPEIQKCERMHDEIAAGLEHAFRFNDLTPSQFRAYISRPQNFSAREWADIQQQKRLNEDMLQSLMERIKHAVRLEQEKVEVSQESYSDGASLSAARKEQEKASAEDESASALSAQDEEKDISCDLGADPCSEKEEGSVPNNSSENRAVQDDTEKKSGEKPIKKRPPVTRRGWLNMH